jgi:hypothetical protein
MSDGRQTDQISEEEIKGFLRKIGPYGPKETIIKLLQGLNRLGVKKLGIDVLLIDELRWSKKVARRLIKMSEV